MPINISGTNSNQNTTDATASEYDVRYGKTFYGANGKQTGVWSPTVTDFTWDASATPADVMRGKVFYGNSGRLIGSGDLIKKVTITVPAKPSYSTITKEMTNLVRINDGNGVKFNDYAYSSSVSVDEYTGWEFTISNMVEILGMEHSGYFSQLYLHGSESTNYGGLSIGKRNSANTIPYFVDIFNLYSSSWNGCIFRLCPDGYKDPTFAGSQFTVWYV